MSKHSRATHNTLRYFTCSNCGSSQIFNIETQTLVCESCHHETEFSKQHTYRLKEYKLDSALKEIIVQPLTEISLTDILCSICGAYSQWESHQLADQCPYCDSPIARDDDSAEHLPVEGIIPFTLNESSAKKNISTWLTSRWFAPNALKEMAGHTSQLQGVYLPHWTFDSVTQTDYLGKRGDNYIDYVTQTRTVNGKTETVTVPVTRTRWHHVSGTVGVSFDDILINASLVLPQTLVNNLHPWNLNEARPYTEEYVAGLQAHYYQLSLGDAFREAKRSMEDSIRRAIYREIGGDKQRILQSTSHYYDNTYKLLMLPMWYSKFQYRGEQYQVIVNGQTGCVTGRYPKSPIKIALAVLGVAIVTGCIAYFMNR